MKLRKIPFEENYSQRQLRNEVQALKQLLESISSQLENLKSKKAQQFQVQQNLKLEFSLLRAHF